MPLRPLGTAEVLDGAVRLVRANGRAVLAIAVPFAIVRSVLVGLAQYATLGDANASTWVALVGLVVAAGVGAVLTGLLTPIFSADVLGGRMPAGAAVRRVGRLTWGLVLLALVVTVAEGAGLVALVIGGAWLWGIWAVAAPALVSERIGPFRALSRSFHLVSGAFWRTWGIRALGWLLVSVLGLFVTLPAELLAGWVTGSKLFSTTSGVVHPGLFVTIVAIGGVLSGAILAPVSSAIDVLLYTDLRMRREGMDIVLGLPPATAPQPVSAW